MKIDKIRIERELNLFFDAVHKSENKSNRSNVLSAKKTGNLKEPFRVTVFDLIDSTNSEAKRVFQQGDETPALYVAEQQTAGRGRLGRTFYSPENTGIYMTLAYPVHTAYTNAVRMTAKASVAALRGIEKCLPLKLEIKWVNDLYLSGRKVAGILVESQAKENEVAMLIIGIGINVTTADFPADLVGKAGALCSGEIDRTGIIIEVTKELLRELQNLDDCSYLEIYRGRSMVIGREVTYTENGISHVGRAISIDDEGALLVETEKGLNRLNSGEISVKMNC